MRISAASICPRKDGFTKWAWPRCWGRVGKLRQETSRPWQLPHYRDRLILRSWALAALAGGGIGALLSFLHPLFLTLDAVTILVSGGVALAGAGRRPHYCAWPSSITPGVRACFAKMMPPETLRKTIHTWKCSGNLRSPRSGRRRGSNDRFEERSWAKPPLSNGPEKRPGIRSPGATKISARLCANCYAERMSLHSAQIDGLRLQLSQRLRSDACIRTPWSCCSSGRSRKRVFVNSMSDLFQKGVPAEFIQQVSSPPCGRRVVASLSDSDQVARIGSRK